METMEAGLDWANAQPVAGPSTQMMETPMSKEERKARRAQRRLEKEEKRARKAAKAARQALMDDDGGGRSPKRSRGLADDDDTATRPKKKKKKDKGKSKEKSAVAAASVMPPTPPSSDGNSVDDDISKSHGKRKGKDSRFQDSRPASSSSIRKPKPAKKSRPSDDSVTEAGPSRTGTLPKSSIITSRSLAKDKDTAETDEDLREKFKIGGQMEAWLASKWTNYNELKRLEAAGILRYKKGKFVESEKAALRRHLETFKKVNRMDDEELVTIIMGKGRFSDRKDYPKFWPDLATVTPGRPVKSVKDHVKREYDPRGRKGTWKPSEDEALLRAYRIHPNQWAKIANIVERTEEDCRNRYRDELRDRETRTAGHWTPAETARLIDVVKGINRSLGSDEDNSEVPWDLVKKKMEGTRTRTQCRRKWQYELERSGRKSEQRTQPISSEIVSSDSDPESIGKTINSKA